MKTTINGEPAVIVYGTCDRCGCLVEGKHLMEDIYGYTVCAALTRCERRRLERLAAQGRRRVTTEEDLR